MTIIILGTYLLNEYLSKVIISLSMTSLITLLVILIVAYKVISMVISDPKRRFFYATCSKGVTPILAREIYELPEVTNLKEVKSGVFFEGDTRSAYSALMNLRTSLRLMERINMNRENEKNDVINSPRSFMTIATTRSIGKRFSTQI